MILRLYAAALAAVLVTAPAEAQRPSKLMNVDVHVEQRGDPARDCGCRRSVNNPSIQTDARGNRWRCRDCRIPYRGNLRNAKVIQMFSPDDRCTRRLRGTNRVDSVSGNRMVVRVSLKPIAQYHFCLIADGRSAKFQITARPGSPYALPNSSTRALVR